MFNQPARLQMLFAAVMVFATANSQSVKSISTYHIDRYVSNIMETNKISGVAATIVKNGEVAYQNTWGDAIRSVQSVTPDTRFLLYSMTKSFTGVALLKLMNEQSLSLDEPINPHLPFTVTHPSYPYETITIRMLMTHTSGIRDNWTVINAAYSYDEDSPITLKDFLQSYLTPGGSRYSAGQNFGARPGTAFSYSNVNGALAGLLIERLSGKTYAEYCSSAVLRPLGMTQSEFLLANINRPDLAVQYTWQNNTWQSARHLASPLTPAGFLHASNNDMGKWLMFVTGDGTASGTRILPEEQLAEMFQPAVPDIINSTGLFTGYDPLYETWGHTGGVSGTRTCYFINREENWGISVLTNGSGDPYPIFYFLMQAAREYEKMSVFRIHLTDDDADGIPEAGEKVTIQPEIRNNTMGRMGELTVQLTVGQTDVPVDVNETILDGSTPDMGIPTREAFELRIPESFTGGSLILNLSYYDQKGLVNTSTFELPVGLKPILLVQDEHHPQKNMARSIERYTTIFDELGMEYTLYDMSLRGAPLPEMINQYESVYWMTGLDNPNQELLPENELAVLQQYLDQGGSLFLTGQNINDQIGNTVFFSEYLHAQSTSAAWTGSNRVTGVSSTDLGTGLTFSLSGGDSNNTQYSPGAILPLGEAFSFLNWSQTTQSCGIAFSGTYRLIYLAFGVEGISDYQMAKTLISRSDQFLKHSSLADTQTLDNSYQVFPNPAGEELWIKLPDGATSPVELSLLDENGKRLGSSRIDANGELLQVPVDKLSGGLRLIPGIYILSIIAGPDRCVRKIVKL